MQSNYGFTRLEILPGNVGFVDLRAFNDVREAGDTAVAAMNFLANTDAIIIDLRYNGGGSPSMVQLLTSYFLEDATHLNSFYVRESDSYQQFWSSSHVQGPKLLQQPLYLLIGNRTFSAAEEFAYNLKNLKRATLVGQVTGGGAHPVQYHYFEAINFGMTIPFGRAINPITHTNWEGTGIAPHIEVVSADALDVAHQKALENLLANTQNEILRHARTWALELLQSRRVPFEIARDELNDYVGDFGGRTIRLQRDALVYVRGTRQLKMIPLAKDAFRFNELDNLRLYFKRDSRGRVVGLTVKYNNGREIKAIKTR